MTSETPGPSGPADTPPPGLPAGWAPAPPRHPQATTVLVLGILGIVACGVLAPIAWYMGSKAMAEIDATPGAYSGEGEVRTGRILGIVGSVLFALMVVFLIIGFVVLLIGAASGGFDSGGMPERY